MLERPHAPRARFGHPRRASGGTRAARSIARACARRPVPRNPCADLRPIFEHPGNYPYEAARRDEQGVVYYRVDVGVNGRVTACEITRTSGSQKLDEGTCAVFRQRMIYDPARDAQGRPVPGEDRGHVTWHLPGL
jgi:TonB family protein